MGLKSISNQLIALIKKNRVKIDDERFNVLEFDVKGGKVDGMRSKSFIKSGNEIYDND